MAAATGLAAVAPVPPPAPACGAINAAVPLPELLARLGKKAHFEDAVRQLTQQAMLGTHSAEQLLPLAARTHALLKARYTAPGFWQAGQRLWRALLEHPGDALAPGDKAKLAAYLADAQQFSEPGEEAGPREPTLGELLFGLPPPGQVGRARCACVSPHPPSPACNGSQRRARLCAPHACAHAAAHRH